jgi:micrococcal nuclease
MRTTFSALAVALVIAVAAPTASAKVRLLSVVSPISHGSYATLVARVSSSRAICSIRVQYKSGWSHARGLSSKRASAGRVSWRWKVGTNTTPGRWPIYVSCGAAGSFRTSFVVT